MTERSNKRLIVLKQKIVMKDEEMFTPYYGVMHGIRNGSQSERENQAPKRA